MTQRRTGELVAAATEDAGGCLVGHGHALRGVEYQDPVKALMNDRPYGGIDAGQRTAIVDRNLGKASVQQPRHLRAVPGQQQASSSWRGQAVEHAASTTVIRPTCCLEGVRPQ